MKCTIRLSLNQLGLSWDLAVLGYNNNKTKNNNNKENNNINNNNSNNSNNKTSMVCADRNLPLKLGFIGRNIADIEFVWVVMAVAGECAK